MNQLESNTKHLKRIKANLDIKVHFTKITLIALDAAIGSIPNFGGTTLQEHSLIKAKVLKGHFRKQKGTFPYDCKPLGTRAPSAPRPLRLRL